MEPIPLPAPIHYEVALRLLEQQTTFALSQRQHQRELAHELIITLRKALSQQKRLEESCSQAGLAIDYRWSLAHGEGQSESLHKG
ncbi:MAG: DUF5340 domain-containing protein [Prochlorotrichaceae cyanobacterium]|jgi:hypothetical protein